MVDLPSGGVLVASPNTLFREQVRQSLPDRTWPVQEALGGADALVKLETGNWQLLFLDRRLPDLDVEELIQIIRRRFPGIQVVMVDSDCGQPLSLGSSAMPVATEKPRTSCSVSGIQQQQSRSQAEPLPGMIGSSQPMLRLYQLARLVAPRMTTVLITGPTGSGKELVARALHELSPRISKPFVVVNCAAIPEALLESELFGHARGAFTGALQAYPGRILAAQNGTLFLDEVGELPLSLQAKLLRFLDSKELQRLGSAETVRADVRVVAATNADLSKRAEAGGFREDLYYRLSAFPLELPSLAERISDLAALAEYFLKVMCTSPAPHPHRLSEEAISLLQGHRWGGNVRELQQVIERAAILAQSAPEIRPEHCYFAPGRRARGEV